jgi:hypothetical protein
VKHQAKRKHENSFISVYFGLVFHHMNALFEEVDSIQLMTLKSYLDAFYGIS